MLEQMFGRVEQGDLSPADGIEHFACNALIREDQALTFEILAESYRNPRVADVVHSAQARYRELAQRLVLKAKPELGAAALEACVEIMTACFYGLGLVTSSRCSLSVELLSRAAGCLILRGLGAQLSDTQYQGSDVTDC
jgi:TetR/AcrR family transcriptional repressor of uid operon